MENIVLRRELLSEATSAWCRQVSAEDICLAVELGHLLVAKVRHSMPAHVSQISGLPAQVSRPAITSSLAGRSGEEFIEGILARRFGGITNVARCPKSGDLSLRISHRSIIVEVKNYNTPVPASSVSKFQRDVATTSPCGGVFISLQSPIAAVTSDFVLRYECTGSRSVPCAYIVSSDESAIIVAVNMVSQLVIAAEYAAAELKSHDATLAGVCDILERVKDVSRARGDLQDGIGKITSQLMKTASCLTVAEGNMRRAAEEIRADLSHNYCVDISAAVSEMESTPSFARLSPDMRGRIASMMKCVPQGDVLAVVVWKFSAKKCVHIATGIGFSVTAARVDVQIPRARLSPEKILAALSISGKKISIGDHVSIELDEATHEWLCEVIRS